MRFLYFCTQGGLLFLGMLFLAFGELGGLPGKFGERTVFAKQSSGAGFYTVFPFVLSASLVDAFTVLIKTICYSCSIYFLAGLNLGSFGERFAFYILVIFCLSLFVSTYARALSTLSNKDLANALGGVGLIVMVMFSGFLGSFTVSTLWGGGWSWSSVCSFVRCGQATLGHFHLLFAFPLLFVASFVWSVRGFAGRLGLLLPSLSTPRGDTQLFHLVVLDLSCPIRLLCAAGQ